MAEEKIMEFKETDEQGNSITEETPKAVIKPENNKKGLFAFWKGLKLWQRLAILAGTATIIFVGGKWMFKSKKRTKMHEAEGKVILNALEDAQQMKVVVPMDTVNNAADAAVQGLVDELAKSAEDAGANVVNF